MRGKRFLSLAAAVAVVLSSSVPALAVGVKAVPLDLGAAADLLPAAPLTVTVALKLRDPDAMNALVQSTYTPHSADFHRFLSGAEFAAKFGPDPDAVARVTAHFEAAGLRVARATLGHLSVSGSVAALEAEFGVKLHVFEVPAAAGAAVDRFHAPLSAPVLSPAVADAVQSVYGFDTRPQYRPHLLHAAAPSNKARLLPPAAAHASGNPPGSLTVKDFVAHYDVEPVYKEGINGASVTLGIVTLASFTPQDAFDYWHSLGLYVSPTRIHLKPIDGGAGPPSDLAGSDETTLDVEQAGGIATQAKIDVYIAPNTAQGFVDAFAEAIDKNRNPTISCSWGQWEYLDLVAAEVTDPTSGRAASTLQALNDLFAQAALQGQSLFVASGDSGAYDSTESYPVPSYPLPYHSVLLSVDDPAAQQWVTAVGGTTLAGTQTYAVVGQKNVVIDIPGEQAWGWDYLKPLCKALALDPVTCGIYPTGSGGGVSALVPLPFYQSGIEGIQVTANGQALWDYSQNPPALVVSFPGGFAGRNVPDVSFNADPQTGYSIYYTSSAYGFGIESAGGTSFAAPQLNGVAALYNQALHRRLGLFNVALYDLLRDGSAYAGSQAPLRDIKSGDNWHYHGVKGYDAATGVGVPDVANLLKALRAVENPE